MGFFKSVARAVSKAVGFAQDTTVGRIGAGVLTGGLSELNRPAIKVVSNAIGGFGGGGQPAARGGATPGEVDAAARKRFGTEALIGGLNFEDILKLTKDDPSIKDPIERRFKRIESFEEATKEQLAKFAGQGLQPERDEDDRLRFDDVGKLISQKRKQRGGFGTPSSLGRRRAF